jgi:hypothetical protein
MEQVILTATSPRILEKKIQEHISEGFVPVGSHKVVTIYSQNKFSGTQHMATQHDLEYSQSMVRNKAENIINKF